jgi:hypothetical protein
MRGEVPKQRVRQRPVRLLPSRASAAAEQRFVQAVDVLLAQLARHEVHRRIKGDSHALPKHQRA